MDDATNPNLAEIEDARAKIRDADAGREAAIAFLRTKRAEHVAAIAAIDEELGAKPPRKRRAARQALGAVTTPAK